MNSAIDLLNGISAATWSGSETGTRVSVRITGKLSRKMRKALNNRRWEKKAYKAIAAFTGIPLVAIRKREN